MSDGASVLGAWVDEIDDWHEPDDPVHADAAPVAPEWSGFPVCMVQEANARGFDPDDTELPFNARMTTPAHPVDCRECIDLVRS